MGGDFLKEIVRTGLRNKKKNQDVSRDKKARTRPAEAEKGKGRRIERAREINKKGTE